MWSTPRRVPTRSLIEEVRVFDEFVGGSLGEGKKSLAITVRLQPTDKTLTEDEIDASARPSSKRSERRPAACCAADDLNQFRAFSDVLPF